MLIRTRSPWIFRQTSPDSSETALKVFHRKSPTAKTDRMSTIGEAKKLIAETSDSNLGEWAWTNTLSLDFEGVNGGPFL